MTQRTFTLSVLSLATVIALALLFESALFRY
jgi:hypothetical protein